MTDIVSIPETERLYKDEWLLFEVLESDALGQPLRGRLLCHHPDLEVMHEVDMRVRPFHGYRVYTGPPVADGFEAVL